jgi:hypothetical protein
MARVSLRGGPGEFISFSSAVLLDDLGSSEGGGGRVGGLAGGGQTTDCDVTPRDVTTVMRAGRGVRVDDVSGKE